MELHWEPSASAAYTVVLFLSSQKRIEDKLINNKWTLTVELIRPDTAENHKKMGNFQTELRGKYGTCEELKTKPPQNLQSFKVEGLLHVAKNLIIKL